jgi:hypothetical protein
MTKIISLIVWVLAAAVASGQTPVKFRSTLSMGLAEGQAGGSFQLQTIDGISRGPWFLGAGAGLDYYRFRTVPLFVSAGRDLRLNKRDVISLFLNGGTNLAWKGASSSPLSDISTNYHGGEYWSGGVHYVWKLGTHSDRAILFTAGYTVKRMRVDQTMQTEPPCYLNGNCAMSYSTIYNYLNRAILLMLGYRF